MSSNSDQTSDWMKMRRPNMGQPLCDVDDFVTYQRVVEKWRDDLKDFATGALSISLSDEERENLQRAVNSLSGITELVKITEKIPNRHDRAHALSCLWGAITSAFIIGSHAVKNPVSGKLQTKGAASVQNSRSEHLDSLVEKYVKIVLRKNPTSPKANSITTLILERVNDELVEIPRPLTAAEKKMEQRRTRQVATLTNQQDKGKLKAGEFEAEIEKLKPLPDPKEKAAEREAIRKRVTKILAKIRKEAA